MASIAVSSALKQLNKFSSVCKKEQNLSEFMTYSLPTTTRYQRRFSSQPVTNTPLSGPKVTLESLREKYRSHQPISMVTAYDFPTGMLADKGGVDGILVGDSLGMVVLGYENTTQVTMDHMVHHCQAVSRGARRPFLIGDMPFGSYEISSAQAVENAFRLIKDGKMEAVKLEGGKRIASRVDAITQAGIPVIGHIGLTPQTASLAAGFKVQGKSGEAAALVLADALALQAAGCSLITLEAIPQRVAAVITEVLDIPTIGIGAGPHTSGQILVMHDMVGLFDRFVPKFCKQYLQAGNQIETALRAYVEEVSGGKFPLSEHSFKMSAKEYDEFKEMAIALKIPAVDSAFTKANLNRNKKVTESSDPLPENATESTTTTTFNPEVTSGYKTAGSQSQMPDSVSPEMTKLDCSTGVSMLEMTDSASAETLKNDSPSQPEVPAGTKTEVTKRTNMAGSKLGASFLAQTASKPLRVAVIGAGATGGFFSARLARQVDLTVIHHKPDVVDSIAQYGLSLVEMDGSLTQVPVKAETGQHPDGLYDVVLLCVKSNATAALCSELPRLLAPNGRVVTLQNGLGNAELIANAVGAERVLQGVTYAGMEVLQHPADGYAGLLVRLAGHGNTHLAPLVRTSHNSEMTQKVASLFTASGIQTVVEPGMLPLVWTKLMVNSAINPLTAVWRVPNGGLLSQESRSVVQGIVGEVYEVAKGSGVNLPFSLSAGVDKVFDVARATSANWSSMCTDVRRGRPTEIDAINGAVVQAGSRLNIPTPHNAMMVSLVAGLTKSATQ